jgi:hypothetical protein
MARDFSLLQKIKTGSGAHPAFCSMSDRGFFPGIKCAGCTVDHSPHIGLRLRISLAIHLLPLYVFTMQTWTTSPFTYEDSRNTEDDHDCESADEGDIHMEYYSDYLYSPSIEAITKLPVRTQVSAGTT